jgi:ketosteroid isomerase-like protein
LRDGPKRVGQQGLCNSLTRKQQRDWAPVALLLASQRSLATTGLSRDTSRAVSQENVEIVQAAINAFNREDWHAAFQDTAAGFEVDLSRAVGPWRGFYGLDQMRGILKEFDATWQSVRIEPQEFIEVGDLVVVPWTLHTSGREGIEVVSRAAWVWTICDGAIERVSMYQERQDALEAVGRSEPDTQSNS